MIWLELLIAAAVICFAGVLAFGAPYLPTLKRQIDIALDLADLRPGDTLLELGCGDGRVLVAAARRGINVVGYELNPILAAVAWLRTIRYRRQVKVIMGDFWRQQWPPADAIFTFLLPRLMPKLDKKIHRFGHRPLKLVSFAFEIPDKPAAVHSHGVYLYVYKQAD